MGVLLLAVIGGVLLLAEGKKAPTHGATANSKNVIAAVGTATTGAAIISSPAIANGVGYVASDQMYGFLAIGCGSSSCPPVWTAPIGSNGILTSSPAIVNGTVYIGSTDTNLYAFRLSGVAH